jgi:hypothetical protein
MYSFIALNAASSVGAGPSLAFPSPRQVTIVAQYVFSGAYTDIKILTEASLDGVTFVSSGTIEFTPSSPPAGYTVTVFGAPAVQVRSRLVSITADPGTTVTETWAVAEGSA